MEKNKVILQDKNSEDIQEKTQCHSKPAYYPYYTKS